MEYTEIKKQLKFGDVSTIAKEVGVSCQTVQMVIRGEITHTPAAQAVMAGLQMLFNQRAERVAFLTKRIAELKEQRAKANEKL